VEKIENHKFIVYNCCSLSVENYLILLKWRKVIKEVR